MTFGRWTRVTPVAGGGATDLTPFGTREQIAEVRWSGPVHGGQLHRQRGQQHRADGRRGDEPAQRERRTSPAAFEGGSAPPG